MQSVSQNLNKSSRHFVLWLFLTICACCPCSSLCSAELTSGERQVVLNPYQSIDWATVGRYKAALHVHTLQSDGRYMPDEVIHAYRDAGFKILAITDHDWHHPNLHVLNGNLSGTRWSPYPLAPIPANYPANTTWPWTSFGGSDPSTLGMVGIQAGELTFRHHINSYFSDYGVWYERTGRDAPYGGIVDATGREVWEDDQLISIRDKGGLAILNHPGLPDSFTWWERKPLDWYVERFQIHDPSYLVGMEVTNAAPKHELYDEGLWDQLLSRFMPHRPIWGFGNDDNHVLKTKISYNLFLMDELTSASVRKALLDGQFLFTKSTAHADYTSSNVNVDVFPIVKSITLDPAAGTITIDAAGHDEIRWISSPMSTSPSEDYRTSDTPWDQGRVVHTGATLDLRRTPHIRHYVRAEILRRDGESLHRVFTNPFGIAEVTSNGPAPSAR